MSREKWIEPGQSSPKWWARPVPMPSTTRMTRGAGLPLVRVTFQKPSEALVEVPRIVSFRGLSGNLC